MVQWFSCPTMQSSSILTNFKDIIQFLQKINLGTIHILRKHIFRIFGPLSLPPLRKHVFSTKTNQKLTFSDPPPPSKCLRNI
jgi:hypothetical protein